MNNAEQLARQFLAAIAADDAAQYEAVLREDVGLRVWGWQGGEARRPRREVVGRLRAEWAAWPDPTLEVCGVIAQDDRAAVEFRIQATEQGRYVEHNRLAV